ncbi:hypothetical protein SUGI_0776830 [Cryptomeria japonica]|nr:hypothetical protein SUGI_0776830 [Cryptomeria japonica]
MPLYNKGSRFFVRGHGDEDLIDSVGDKTPNAAVRTYADVMCEEAMKREKEETLRLIAKKYQKGKKIGATQQDVSQASQKRRNSWDQAQEQENVIKKAKISSDWDATLTPRRANVDATHAINRHNRWDETPTLGRLADVGATSIGDITPGAILQD